MVSMQSTESTVYTVHYRVYRVQSREYSKHYIIYGVHCTVFVIV